MALQLKDGLDVKLVRNSSTGKYDLSFSRTGPNKGNPELEFSRTHAVLTSLLRRKRGQRPGTGVAAGGAGVTGYGGDGVLRSLVITVPGISSC